MPHEILESMRALREEMRQRLLQVPEYRALVSLDRSINELCDILQNAMPQQPMRAEYAQPVAAPAPAPVAAPAAQSVDVAQPRAGGIASAFAETLAAKMDQRNLARASAVYAPPTHRALGA
ncbi:hypothetical protein GJ654_10545 [Rhodoblastus acidophilus]|jgi:hypothetical protein|uniref:Uncharacterized protein n=1 Tax=Rhodoblastus acidophilus TaxID=1074 RepID=A0A6N8DQG4_RHOAC|nr:hypothetical protein [Rhodoblastus acidophilus]MCW2274983.1 hypothetical protein [Rhodoblastus acidophilus]MTV31433.1 hypothetical protein [Rhodoblastus acidophilus]